MNSGFNGIFAPLTSPFEGDSISTEKLRENIQKYNEFELAGYVILGSTGEAVYISDEESEKLVETARESASPEKKIIVGTARESTKITLEFTNRISSLNVDAALVRTPGYYKSKMNREALKEHFLSIADHSKVPIIVYNIPQNTGISVDSELIIELSKHPNIIGLKDSSGNLSFLSKIIPRVSTEFNLLIGAGSVLLPGLILGGCGGIIALSDVAPALCVKLYKLFLKKKLEEARNLQLKLVPLNEAVTQIFGIPGAKYALDLIGYYGGPCRLPLLPLNNREKKEIKEILTDLNLI